MSRGSLKMKVDLNLDDEEEVAAFIKKHGTRKGRSLARALGLYGRGCVAAANALSNYAWNKHTAIGARKNDSVEVAKIYEDICDRIYREDIQGKIECW